MAQVVDDSLAISIGVLPQWGSDENYNSYGITNNMGDGIAYKFTKTSSNPDEWQIDPWASGTQVTAWCFMMRTSSDGSHGPIPGTPQTFHQHVTDAAMQAFYQQLYDGHIFKPWYTEDGVNYTRVTDSWYDTTNNILYLTFTPQSNYCLVAPFFPERYKYNQWFTSLFQNNPYASVYNIQTTPHGLETRMVELTNFSIPETSKKHICIIHHTHPEPLSYVLVQGMMKHIVETAYLRDNFHWYFVPCINVEGATGLYTTPSFYTWNAPGVNIVVDAIRTKFDEVNALYGVDATWDCHAQGTGNSNHLLYGPQALALCQAIIARIPRFVYYDYPSPTPSGITGYSYNNYHNATGGPCLGLVTEPTQRRWIDTIASLEAEGAQIAEGHNDYFF